MSALECGAILHADRADLRTERIYGSYFICDAGYELLFLLFIMIFIICLYNIFRYLRSLLTDFNCHNGYLEIADTTYSRLMTSVEMLLEISFF